MSQTHPPQDRQDRQVCAAYLQSRSTLKGEMFTSRMPECHRQAGGGTGRLTGSLRDMLAEHVRTARLVIGVHRPLITDPQLD